MDSTLVAAVQHAPRRAHRPALLLGATNHFCSTPPCCSLLAAADLSEQELALLSNLQISTAEEARKLVPSLAREVRAPCVPLLRRAPLSSSCTVRLLCPAQRRCAISTSTKRCAISTSTKRAACTTHVQDRFTDEELNRLLTEMAQFVDYQ